MNTKPSMRKKVCIYTICTNGYDSLKTPRARVPGADYFLVTDDPCQQIPGYTQILIEGGDNPIKAQRRVKIWPYDIMPGYDTYVYYDCSYEVRAHLSGLITMFQGGFGVKRHPNRDCIYQEGKRIIELRKATPDAVNEQLAHYAELGIPEHFGLQETGILLRDNSELTRALCAAWLKELDEFTHRDQLALPAAIFRTGIQPVYLRTHMVNPHFRQHPHKQVVKFPTGKPRIWYSTPFDTTKNIGRALNEFCALVPSPEDWICLRDGDSMFLLPDWGNQVEDIIQANKDHYDLIGCMTNRLRGTHQLHKGVCSNNMDMRDHYHIATQLKADQGICVERTLSGIAGVCMLFQRKVWDKVKFKENCINFDTVFSKELLKAKMRIGVAKGLYCLHSYRIWSDTPFDDITHLT
jgi:hypothetical protein